ncbi:MAG: hypothetical protein J6K55_17170 [Clostridia bacterium]|nr:hypothetical protein [Clostridia bacterium]
MKISDLKEPVAITMWDSSWLRRRYAGGGFESFDQALDELKERGYNAVRIDAFPHMIASLPDGSNEERFLDTPGVSWHKYGFAQWGNQWTVYIYPRRDIVDFMRKARERNIYVALSTWLKPTWEQRNDLIRGPEGLIRIWDETLQFLDENGLLDNVIYVDVMNEIPLCACNMWLYHQLDALKTPRGKGMNEEQKTFYRQYFARVLHELKARWPQLSFTASYTHPEFTHDAYEADLSEWDVLDMHMWVDMAPCKILDGTGYEDHIARFGDPDRIYLNPTSIHYTGNAKRIPGDFYLESVNEKVHKAWKKHRNECVEWLDQQMELVQTVGRKFGIPVGNTEGWGSVIWLEHPMLEWDFVKEAGMIAAELGAKHGYLFNCQSNFCEPQYLRLWRDVDYHRQVTSLIRGK